MRCLLILSAALAAPLTNPVAGTGIWKACTIDSVAQCAADGCSPRKPAISLFLSDYFDRGVERSAYYRCALQFSKCDRYRTIVYQTGNFVIFSLPERSAFAKLGPDGRVTDVSAAGDVVFVSRGQCVDRAPPQESALRSR
jgi:hypothetical protein